MLGYKLDVLGAGSIAYDTVSWKEQLVWSGNDVGGAVSGVCKPRLKSAGVLCWQDVQSPKDIQR